MNKDQTIALLTGIAKVIGTILAARGLTAAASVVTSPAVIEAVAGVILTGASFYASHQYNATTPTASVRPTALTKALAASLLVSSLVVGAGCTSIINVPQGKILSVTERGLGFHVKTASTTTMTPDVVFGFWSSAVVVVPTSTNTPVNSPNFANTFDFAQSGAMSLGIGENIAAGNYQTLTPGNTNSAFATQPIVPK